MTTAVKLFAAVDAANQIRFISDVPAGAACGCFRFACGSPLIARKGDVKAHHFAHEASQERPECAVGALNLLRRFAIDFLRSRGVPTLPPYQTQISRRLQSRTAVQTVEWDAQPAHITWLEPVSQGDSVARMILDNDLFADLIIVIASDPPPRARAPSSTALISFYTWLPDYETLCSHVAVREHLRSTGHFVWIYQPDVYGLVADAVALLRRQYEAQEKEAEERVRRDRERFENAMKTSLPYAPPPDTLTEPATPAWAAVKRKNASYFGYRLADGSVWVHFEIATGGFALRPLNLEGWEHEVPSTVGQYDELLDVVVCAAPPSFRSSVGTRISGQFADINALVAPDWNTTGFFRA